MIGAGPRPAAVAIVGGGLSGLAAAESLATSGANVRLTLIEAKRVAGGRTGSFEVGDGPPVDYCQHVAMGCCGELLALMRRAELIRYWRRDDELWFVHARGESPPSRFAVSRWLPPPLHLLPAAWAMRYLTWGEKCRLAWAVGRLLRLDEPELRRHTAGDWLRRAKQTDRVVRRFWEPVLVSALGESIERVSMGPARKVIVEGFAASPEASNVWVPNRPLSEIFGRRLVDHVRGLGVEIRTGTTVKTIGRRTAPVRIDDQRSTVEPLDVDGEAFDAVVLAVPWYRWKSILATSLAASVPRLDDIAAVAGSPITGLHLWFDRPVLSRPHVVLLEGVAHWLFDDPTEQTETASRRHYVQAVISAACSIRDRTKLIEAVVDEVRGLDAAVAAPGGNAAAALVDARVVTDPRSVFAVTPQTESVRPNTRSKHPRLFLAGDIVSTGWPATMEGAVIGGRAAAAAILDRFG